METTETRAVVSCPSCGRRNRVRPTGQGHPACAACHAPLPWLVDADSASFAAETIASVPVVVDFWAAWCGPCRMVAPVLEQLAREHAGRLKVVKVDVDRSPDVAQRYQAMSIPLLVVMRDGREVDRLVGAQPKHVLERRLGLMR
jgi:thioredoxin 2